MNVHATELAISVARPRNRRALLAPFYLPATILLLAVLTWPVIETLVRALLVEGRISFANFVELYQSRLFQVALANTIKFGIWSSVVSILIAYPVAYYASLLGPKGRALVIALVLLPFWTSILVKSFALIVLLGDNGFIRRLLLPVLGDNTPRLVFNEIGVIVAMVHAFIPYLFFPILANLIGQDQRLKNAAYIMGSSRIRAFWTVSMPLSLPGVAAGTVLSFVMSLGYFITPQLMGGRTDVTLGMLVDYYTRESLNWEAASATSVVLLLTGFLCVAVISIVPNGAGLPKVRK